MEPLGSRRARASMVARARFIEDLISEQAGRGVRQYVILGAGLDTFAQRRPELAPSCACSRSIDPGLRPGSGSA
jgi:O-methyltransferase involved in polyketide biosynthesis